MAQDSVERQTAHARARKADEKHCTLFVLILQCSFFVLDSSAIEVSSFRTCVACAGAAACRTVTDYRALELGRAGQVLKRHEFDAADDASAMEHARQHVIIGLVEVWHADRLIGTLYPAKRDV
jgi:hypothetical protein